MDDRLKELMQELGTAINESLSDSERIASAIGEIRRAGYDVFMILEATIGFNKRGSADNALSEPASRKLIEANPEPPSHSGQIRWTNMDHKFLKALKISEE